LKEWTISYIKSRDAILKKIKQIVDKGSYLEVHSKDNVVKYHFIECLDTKIFSLDKGPVFIMTLNTESNLDFLTKSWDKLTSIKDLNIIFVNLANNEKWIISPRLHSMIADPESIARGLRTMFDTCNGKIIEMVKSKKKGSMFEEGSDGPDEEEET